jgi:hypothetical protein
MCRFISLVTLSASEDEYKVKFTPRSSRESQSVFFSALDMAEPLSIASGVAGIITLSSAVVAAGYKYLSSVRSAPEDLKKLIQEIAALNTLISQLVAHSLTLDGPHKAIDAVADQDLIQSCQQTLNSVQEYLRESNPGSGSRGKNAIKVLWWPLKRDDIVKGRDHIRRLCSTLTTALTLDNASALARIERIQKNSFENTASLVHNIEERKILRWLSELDPVPKQKATILMQQPGTSDWLLRKQAVLDWIVDGQFLWLYGPSGCGKTVLV